MSNPSEAGPDQWWLSNQGKPTGPHSEAFLLAGLKSGTLSPQMYVCPVGGSEWKPLSQWPVFAATCPAIPAPPPPPPLPLPPPPPAPIQSLSPPAAPTRSQEIHSLPIRLRAWMWQAFNVAWSVALIGRVWYGVFGGRNRNPSDLILLPASLAFTVAALAFSLFVFLAVTRVILAIVEVVRCRAEPSADQSNLPVLAKARWAEAILLSMNPDDSGAIGEIGAAFRKWLIPICVGLFVVLFLSACLGALIGWFR